MEMLCQQPAYTARDALQSRAVCASSPNCQGHWPRLQTPRGGDTASPSGLVRTPDPSTRSTVCSWLFPLPCLGWAVGQPLELGTSVSGHPGPALVSVSGSLGCALSCLRARTG